LTEKISTSQSWNRVFFNGFIPMAAATRIEVRFCGWMIEIRRMHPATRAVRGRNI
jgi:hypothetical protein